MTIEVTDVDEVPVPKTLNITGERSHTYEENGTDDLGAYDGQRPYGGASRQSPGGRWKAPTPATSCSKAPA